jgi:hypothetical protein
VSATGRNPSGSPPPRAEISALRQIRESAQAWLEQGQGDETCEVLLSALQAMLIKNRALALRLATRRRERIGSHSERIDPGPLALLFDALVGQGGAGSEEVDVETEAKEDAERDCQIERAEPAHPETERGTRTTRKAGPGWQTRGVERQGHHVEVPPAERTCETCKREKDRIGVDVTRRLESVPGHFVEHEHRVDKSACRNWKEGVTTAPAPPHVLARSAADASWLAPRSPEHLELGSIGAYSGDDRDVLRRYAPTGEGATGPWAFLAGRKGDVQADASNVFDRRFTGQAAHAVELGCWSHGRRRLVAMQDTDCRVASPLKLLGRLYRIEHLADARGVTPEGRVALRQARSAPVLDKLRRWCAVTRAHEPPSTDLAKAAGDIVKHWQALSRFLEDGRIHLDNNLSEQQLRDIALGRKHYRFAGSHDAARRAAGLYSVTRPCAPYGVPPRQDVTDVLGKLASGWSVKRLDEWLPHRWRPPEPAPENPSGPSRSLRSRTLPRAHLASDGVPPLSASAGHSPLVFPSP